MWEPRQAVRCILRTAPPPPIVYPGLGLLVVHVAGPFTQISGMEVGAGMEGHGTKCDCTLSVCFTLLFECVLQGNMVDRRLVHGGELPSGVGMFDRVRCGFMAVFGTWSLGWCLGNVYLLQIGAKVVPSYLH